MPGRKLHGTLKLLARTSVHALLRVGRVAQHTHSTGKESPVLGTVPGGFHAVDAKPQPGATQDQTEFRLALKSRAAFEEPGINPP